MDAKQQGRRSEWTVENIELLRDMWLSKVPTPKIAKRLGVTRNAVLGKIRRVGLCGTRGAPLRKPRETKSNRVGYIKSGPAFVLRREPTLGRLESELRWQRVAKYLDRFEDARIPEYDGRRLRLSPGPTSFHTKPLQLGVEIAESSETIRP